MRLFFVSIFCIGIFISCTISKAIETYELKNVQLNLIDLYYQEIVPGQKNQKTLFNLSFKLNDAQIQIDSLVYNSKTRKVQNNRSVYKCNLNEKLTVKEIAIYYQKNEISYFSKHKEIKILEPIFQP